MRWTLLASLVLPLTAFAADRTPAPLPPAKAVASMVVPDGFKVTLFAGRARRGAADLLLHRRPRPAVGRRGSNYGDLEADRQGPHRHPRRHRRRRAGRQAHRLLRGLQLHHRHRSRLRRRLGHVAAEPLLHPRPRRRRQARRPARGRLRWLRLQGEPAQPRQRLHLGAGRLALRRARPHQSVRRRPARHAGRQAHPLRRRRLPHPSDAADLRELRRRHHQPVGRRLRRLRRSASSPTASIRTCST